MFLGVFYPGFQIKVFFSIRSGSNVTSQHDRQDERLTGQLPNQSRHCALTSCYFKLCPLHKSVLSQILLLFNFFTAVHVSSQRTYESLFCSQVRGVGAGGIVSSAFCLLYKLFTLKLTRKQLNGLITHVDSPYIRALGFMFIRYEE